MKRHTPEEIVTKLRCVEALTAEGSTVSRAVREIGVTEVTYYRWRKKCAGVGKPEARRLRDLEKENARRKKLVADLALDNDLLKEVARGKF
jgi:transposase-like protein